MKTALFLKALRSWLGCSTVRLFYCSTVRQAYISQLRDSALANIPFYISSSGCLCRLFNHKTASLALLRLRFCSIRGVKSNLNLSVKPGTSASSKSLRPANLKAIPCLCLLIAVMFCATACAGPSTKVSEQHSTSGTDQTKSSTKLTLKKPATLYLADFNLEPSIMTSSREHRNNIVRKVLPRSRHDDVSEKSKKLVAVLSDAIKAELESGGQHILKINGEIDPSTGLPQDKTLPEDGWLIGGWFVKVDEGDRVMQSAVGFGAGAEKVELIVLVTDLSNRAVGPFLTIGSENGKKKVPGAILMMNPYMLAAKFVLSSKTTERDTKKIGKSIADNLLEYIKSLPAAQN